MKRHHFFLLVLVLFVARAAGKPDDIISRSKQLERNGDGKNSRAECDMLVKLLPRFRDDPDEAKQLFERLETDGDGVLTREDFKKHNSSQ